MRINQNPFNEIAVVECLEILPRIFTGRDREIKSVLNQLRGTNRKRVLVYGNIGIGKTALILSVLDVLQRKIPNILTCYISLPMNTDLGTAALGMVQKRHF
jgi:Cdc6-like AAA superfamily ATPase